MVIETLAGPTDSRDAITGGAAPSVARKTLSTCGNSQTREQSMSDQERERKTVCGDYMTPDEFRAFVALAPVACEHCDATENVRARRLPPDDSGIGDRLLLCPDCWLDVQQPH